MLPWRKTWKMLLPLEIVSPHRERLRKEKAYHQQAEELLKTVGLEDANILATFRRHAATYLICRA